MVGNPKPAAFYAGGTAAFPVKSRGAPRIQLKILICKVNGYILPILKGTDSERHKIERWRSLSAVLLSGKRDLTDFASGIGAIRNTFECQDALLDTKNRQ